MDGSRILPNDVAFGFKIPSLSPIQTIITKTMEIATVNPFLFFSEEICRTKYRATPANIDATKYESGTVRYKIADRHPQIPSQTFILSDIT